MFHVNNSEHISATKFLVYDMNFQIGNFIFFNHVGDKAIICENTADLISKIHELIKEKCI